MPFGRERLHNIAAVKQFTKFFGGVLSAAVGMKQQSRRFSAGTPCSLKCVDGKLDIHFGTDPVSNHFSCKQIDDNAEETKPTATPDVSDIADPNLVGCRRVESLLQVVWAVSISGICRKNRFGFDG